jgi:hypothetical protein
MELRGPHDAISLRARSRLKSTDYVTPRDPFNSGVGLLTAGPSFGECDALQRAELTASDGAPGDLFGLSVNLDGDTAVVSGHRNDDDGEASGSAYVFVRDADGLWTEQADLTSDDIVDVVDVFDLLTLLSDWGPGGGASNLNGDGDVSVMDLLILLGAWGPCA